MSDIVLKPYQFNGDSNKQSEGKWYPRVAHYSTINADELCRLAAEDSRVDRAEVKFVISAIVKQVKELVFNGHSIRIPELGILSLSSDSKTVEHFDDIRLDRMIEGFHLNFRPTKDIQSALKKVSLRVER